MLFSPHPPNMGRKKQRCQGNEAFHGFSRSGVGQGWKIVKAMRGIRNSGTVEPVAISIQFLAAPVNTAQDPIIPNKADEAVGLVPLPCENRDSLRECLLVMAARSCVAARNPAPVHLHS